ncbi:hypothetical protein PC117_g10593 [Phytophthora cactorum]|uniref:Uncharacterized protein n=1 Tax=Phytophthora cactorum TaxID=29920 RepID=A0A8T1DGY1_9STRA|nr:hypothetical protein PC117_g10593 [Phytophthora cactorum]
MSSPTRATTAPVPSDPGIPHGPPSKKSKKRLRSVGAKLGGFSAFEAPPLLSICRWLAVARWSTLVAQAPCVMGQLCAHYFGLHVGARVRGSVVC